MIEISPAILEDNEKDFLNQLRNYLDFANHIDIDVNIKNDDFVGKETLSVSRVAMLLQNIDHFFGIHLMVTNPLKEINEFLNIKKDFKGIFYIHQESNIDVILNSKIFKKHSFGITVKAESNIRSIEFYKNFPEVQLMTIETGIQGNPFKPEVLKRVEWLRSEGYLGKISIDGSVNLHTSELIREYPLDRVSVGSYLAKAQNPLLNYQKLYLALNMNRVKV